MIHIAFHHGVAGVSLALATVPATACPLPVDASAHLPLQRVGVIATSDGFAIAARKDAPVSTAPRQAVPLGASIILDRDVLEQGKRHIASGGR